MQDKDFEWFVENYDEIYKKYGHAIISIKNKKVLGAYPSFREAVDATEKNEELGTFIVQECNGDPSAYTGHIASMFF